MISSRRIKAARALLDWKGWDLADKSGVATLKRYEVRAKKIIIINVVYSNILLC